MRNNFFGQPQDFRVLNTLFNKRNQNALVYADEKTLNIHLKKVQIRGDNFFEVADSFMSAFEFAAGVRVENKHFFPYRFKIADKQMMDDAIPKISGSDLAQFRVSDGKTY